VIVHINSYPGVGKLTIGKALAELIGGRLLDNHSVFNVAFALTEFKSPAFYDTVREVREIAYRRILDLPREVPVVLTNWYSRESTWGQENWDRAIALAKERRCALNIVTLTCQVEENVRRIQSPGRGAKRKPQDESFVKDNRDGRPLLDRGGDRLLNLDVTHLSAEEAAQKIAAWLTSAQRGPEDHERTGRPRSAYDLLSRDLRGCRREGAFHLAAQLHRGQALVHRHVGVGQRLAGLDRL
jgi:hypothetical protein